jgi:hypothetical protein
LWSALSRCEENPWRRSSWKARSRARVFSIEAAKEGESPGQRRDATFAEYLLAMPDAGENADFERPADAWRTNELWDT